MLGGVLATLVVASLCAGQDRAQEAAEILKSTGNQGGLVVHLGCGDGTLTAALHANQSFLVHGLDGDAANVAKARAYLRSKGLYGKVSVELWKGKCLPYIDNMVNLVVAEDLGGVEMAEVMRVLAPQGVAYVKDRAWKKTVKPRPQDIDEWTHYLHGPNNNAVAQDEEVGSPRHLQWLAAPLHARSHEHLATVSAVVSARGRLFSIVDEGPTLAVVLPAKWRLVACDAFNGLELWRRRIGPWESHMNWFRAGPGSLARRLIAVGDRVYVTPGYGRAVEALDAATGRTVKTYQGTENAREILCANGLLYLVLGPVETQQGVAGPPLRDRILALDAATGKTLWSLENDDTVHVMSTTLAIAGGRAYFQNPKAVVCVDARSGQSQWRTVRASGGSIAWSPPTLVVVDDVLLSADPTAPAPPEDPDAVKPTYRNRVQTNAGELVALSTSNGRFLWKARCYPNFMSAVDVLVADGVVWTGQLWSVVNPGVTSARDLHTGKIVRRRPPDNPDDIVISHHRCHRFRATDHYLVLSRAGIDLLDTKTGNMEFNPWIRGTCQLGPIPCNGLIYAPPHSCACFAEAMFPGYLATADRRAPVPAPGPALEKGPAYGKIAPAALHDDRGAWPTYRGDAARSGTTETPVAAALQRAWQRNLGGRLSAPTAADGMVFVADVDAHTVYALDAPSGRTRWTYTAGGRVDSPPTISRGCAVFGSADGWVYCLRAGDGELVWRFRAAPNDQRLLVRGRLESVWPVPGSVLVRDGQVWLVAGRTSFLDGGLHLHRLDLATGQSLSTTQVDQRDPKLFAHPARIFWGFNMPGALNDILSSDGKYVFMRQVVFGPDGAKLPTYVPHLFSQLGFLDDSWWHRSFWIIGAKMEAGARNWGMASTQVPFGQLLCLGNDVACGFGRTSANKQASHVGAEDTRFQLFAFAAEKKDRKAWAEAWEGRSGVHYFWKRSIPLLGRAMLLADKTLWVAGPPDLVLQKNAEASAALAGDKGAVLWAVSTADGKTLAEHKLDAPPVFDGMAASAGQLFVSLQNGRILCMKGRE